MTPRQRSLVGGISILAAAGLICKVVGVLYRIPLANLIGPPGMGVYNQVFPTYNLMLAISSAGIPVAISRMVAGSLARGHAGNARRMFRIALIMLGLLGLVSMLVMMLFSGRFAQATGTPESKAGFMMIAPSLFFVCAMSAFRGYMQGQRRMWPTAISQLIEQVGKVGVALPLAYAGMARGGFVLGAAGALLGTTIAEGAAMLYMMADYLVARPRLVREAESDTSQPTPTKAIARELVVTAIPITIGASIVPLAGAVDSFMLVRQMKAYLPELEALSRYGIYGLVLSLINVPTALAMAMSTNLVPAISEKRARRDHDGVKRDAATGIRLAMVVGLPSSVGMSLLAHPILTLLFGREYTPEQLRLGADLLEISSLTIVVFTLVQATSGILQGMRKQRIPMYTLAAGIVVKIAINYTAVNRPEINIGGAPYASLACYILSGGLNLYYVIKITGLRWSWQETVLRPGLATLVMALPVYLISALWGQRIGRSWLLMGLVLAGAVALYGFAALKTGAIRRSELPFSRLRGRD
ncbi:MAG: polysaccharide biosynthesis protein [Eubacteriales bacterium]|nr:polysaccharide biosynthesis protein [Eubacteriales bacterium]